MIWYHDHCYPIKYVLAKCGCRGLQLPKLQKTLFFFFHTKMDVTLEQYVRYKNFNACWFLFQAISAYAEYVFTNCLVPPSSWHIGRQASMGDLYKIYHSHLIIGHKINNFLWDFSQENVLSVYRLLT